MTPEVQSLLVSVFCGVLAVVLLGVRNAIRGGLIINIIADTIWWVISLGIFIYCMWETADFRIRFYHIIGVGVGVSTAYFTICRFITEFAGRLFTVIFKILLTPCVFLYKIVIVLINKTIGSNLRKVAKNDTPER